MEQLLGMIEIIKVEHHPMHIAAGHILVHRYATASSKSPGLPMCPQTTSTTLGLTDTNLSRKSLPEV